MGHVRELANYTPGQVAPAKACGGPARTRSSARHFGHAPSGNINNPRVIRARALLRAAQIDLPAPPAPRIARASMAQAMLCVSNSRAANLPLARELT